MWQTHQVISLRTTPVSTLGETLHRKFRYGEGMWRQIRAALSARQIFFLAALALLTPIRTIGALNIETWAADRGLDRLLLRLEGPALEALQWAWSILSSEWLFAFVLGGVVASFWGNAKRLILQFRDGDKSEKRTPWKEASPEIRELLLNMAKLSHEIYMMRYAHKSGRDINNNKIEDLLETVKDKSIHFYFDEHMRLLMMSYIYACELQISVENRYHLMKAQGIRVDRNEKIDSNDFIENAPINFARMMNIEFTPLIDIEFDNQSPEGTEQKTRPETRPG